MLKGRVIYSNYDGAAWPKYALFYHILLKAGQIDASLSWRRIDMTTASQIFDTKLLHAQHSAVWSLHLTTKLDTPTGPPFHPFLNMSTP